MSTWTLKICITCHNPRRMPIQARECGACTEKRTTPVRPRPHGVRLRGLKRERAKAGFSLTVLSKKTGISREGINGYERGKYGAWPAKAKLLADALGVPLSQITDEAKTRRAS